MPSPQTTRRFVNSLKASLISGAPYRIEKPRQAGTGHGDDLVCLDNLLEAMVASVNALSSLWA
jgi:hypothetical protein